MNENEDLPYLEEIKFAERIVRGEKLITIATERNVSITSVTAKYARIMKQTMQWHEERGKNVKSWNNLAVIRHDSDYWLGLLNEYKTFEKRKHLTRESGATFQKLIADLTIDEFTKLMTEILRSVPSPRT